ncbi:type II toxin-antitoxin system ParD family antitoxin [Caulobacter sp. NIBR1757]|uniref:ribbon-helix-helix domain-containing protein n=1 Tax=Caulobacter sp. NIBR1757 TaxID=3016000 RepID=UPI0022F0B75C|nr:type II toxin-antitoxin system ParD family antitoxin [Caulobacter sp. NIBR1757]
MSTSLTPDQEALLERAVASGRFASREDAVAEALAMLDERLAKHARLKRDIEIGLESGPGEAGSFTEVARRARARFEAQQASGKGPPSAQAAE